MQWGANHHHIIAAKKHQLYPYVHQYQSRMASQNQFSAGRLHSTLHSFTNGTVCKVTQAHGRLGLAKSISGAVILA